MSAQPQLKSRPRPLTLVVPRWLAYAAGLLLLSYIGTRVMRDPVWTVQRLASPDGQRTAVLQRTTYVKDHFRVRVKDGRLWFTPYYSPPFTNDFRVDLGERLRWSEDSNQLFFRLRGQEVWVYDFNRGQGRNLTPPATP